MERIRRPDGGLPTACFLCPARVPYEDQDYCDTGRLDDDNIIKKVARYRPSDCPRKNTSSQSDITAEIMLRKMLGR